MSTSLNQLMLSALAIGANKYSGTLRVVEAMSFAPDLNLGESTAALERNFRHQKLRQQKAEEKRARKAAKKK